MARARACVYDRRRRSGRKPDGTAGASGMSETDSFIEEVTEEVRRDRLFAFFRRFGWILVLTIILIVGYAAWTEWQKSQFEASARVFGEKIAKDQVQWHIKYLVYNTVHPCRALVISIQNIITNIERISFTNSFYKAFEEKRQLLVKIEMLSKKRTWSVFEDSRRICSKAKKLHGESKVFFLLFLLSCIMYNV